MKERILRIRLHEFDETSLRETDLIGLISYKGVGGQGDIAHCRTYLCKICGGGRRPEHGGIRDFPVGRAGPD